MSTLYHYCSASSFASIIENQSIWLSSLSLSNDSAEGKIVGTTFKALFEKRGLEEKKVESAMQFINKLEEITDGLGFCLSESGDLLSQWRGYAHDGRGYSVGFSKEYLEELASKKPNEVAWFRLNKVIYTPEEHEKALQPIFDQVIEDILEGKLEMPGMLSILSGHGDSTAEYSYELALKKYQQSLHQLVLKIFKAIFHLYTLKNHAFQEEKEWRLISHLMRDQDDQCNFRVSNNNLIPFRSYLLEKYSNPIINEVILGPKNITPEFVVKSFLKQKGFGDVSVKRSSATYR